MTADQALHTLDPERWSTTSVLDRLALIEAIQKNLKTYATDLGVADAKMKNDLIGEAITSTAEGMAGTVVPMASTLLGIHRFYESLARGHMLAPKNQRALSPDLHEIEVYPIHPKDKLAAGKLRGYLHVQGEPKQISPLDKPAGIIAISGAGNYSSSIEMAMAIFLENKAAIHKPHNLNVATDRIWERIFAPLVEVHALAFCDADQGRAIPKLPDLHAVYFTGSTSVGHAIQDAASAPLISECGGNNPCIVIPGDRPWTDKELRHQAVQLASIGKMNGGAICGRPQTIITSKSWNQREDFLDALRDAIAEDTFACGSHYPGVEKTRDEFIANQPTAEIISPEGGRHPKSDFVFIPGIGSDDFAAKNEAFCQVISEMPLATSDDVDDFLSTATDFCNKKLLGSLACMILVDPDTYKKHGQRISQAITELNYGGIAVNTIPPNIWLNGYLTWGGNGESEENFVSGVGNFGNALNFANVVKSVVIDDFSSASFELTNRKRFEHLLENVSYYSIDQSWRRFTKLAGQLTVDSLKGKDF